MKEKKELTVKYLKEKREVSLTVKDNLKRFNQIKKVILTSLKEKPKSIPQITDETGLASELVTYYLMTLRKYHSVEVDELDDNDEYYTYKIK